MTPEFSPNCPLFEDLTLQPQDGLSSENSIFPGETLIDACDGLPRSQPNQYFRSLDFHKSGVEHSLDTNMPPRMVWSQLHMPNPQYAMIGDYYGVSQGAFERTSDRLFRANLDNNLPFGRPWQQNYDSKMVTNFEEESGLSADFLLDTLKESSPDPQMECQVTNYASIQNPQDNNLQRIGRSPTVDSQVSNASPSGFQSAPPFVDMSSFGGGDDDKRHNEKKNIVACEERISNEPYAKLIYRALLGAPNHSMVLQEIYQWFIKNTDKGNSSSSGWRNSIRHNLSMNAAFRKTDRTPVGDEPKKTSEWVLEPFAIRKGVTPTTRYRKQGKKTIRSEHPAPARVKSGRAGGLSAGKTKVQRQKSHDEHYEMQNRRRESHGLPCMIQGLDYHQTTQSTLGQHDLGMGSPYHSKPPSLDSCIRFEDVMGVHMDDGPLLYLDGNEQFSAKNPHLWSDFHN